MLNNHNTQPERDRANRRRQISRNKALEARRETAEEIQTIDNQLSQINQTKKESREREKALREQKKALQEAKGLSRSPQKPNRARGKTCLPDYPGDNTTSTPELTATSLQPYEPAPDPSPSSTLASKITTQPNLDTPGVTLAPPNPPYQSQPHQVSAQAPPLYAYYHPAAQHIYYSSHQNQAQASSSSTDRQAFSSIDTNAPQFYPGYTYPLSTYPFYPSGYSTPSSISDHPQNRYHWPPSSTGR